MKKLHKTIRRVALIAIIFLLVYAVCSLIFSAVFFQVAFCRRDSVPEVLRISYELLDAPCRRRSVSFPSGDNTLHGWLYGEDNRGGLVIIAPGVNSDADAHLPEILRFAESGYAVLAYDPTGMFSSGGESRVGLQQSKRDLNAAIAFAKREKAELPVFLYGHSLGGYAAAAVLADADVAAAVSVAGFDSPVGTMHGKARESVGVLADIEYPFLWLQNYFVFGDDADACASESIGDSDTPVLVVCGSDDAVIPYDLSLYAHVEASPKVSRELIDDEWRSGHSYQWLSADAAQYVAALQEELDDLRDVCGGEVPDDVLADFYRDVDAEKATETDEAFMNEVCAFFEKNGDH